MIPGDYPKLLVDCLKCGAIFSEIDPVYKKVTERYSSYKGYEGMSMSFELIYGDVLNKVLAKEDWRVLLNGGYVCPKCSEKLIKESSRFTNKISNSMKGFIRNIEKDNK